MSAFSQMGIHRHGGHRRIIAGEASNEDVEEEEVRVGDGEEEGMRAPHGLEVREPVGEFGDGGEVVLEAIEDDLSVRLGELRERACTVQQTQEEVSAARCWNHL